MNDDIVTRLYGLCLCCGCGCEQSCSDCEAADEIERLRNEVNVWRGICERFERAVRGE